MPDASSLEARIDALESRQAITEVLHRYARGWDRRDVEAVTSCFWPDSTHRHGVFEGLSADFVALTECYFAAIHHRPAPDGDEEYFLEGRFVDVFERRAGEWRIVRRQGLNEYERVQPRRAAPMDELPITARGRRKPDDALYALQAQFRGEG
jgi:hypothetical protein